MTDQEEIVEPLNDQELREVKKGLPITGVFSTHVGDDPESVATAFTYIPPDKIVEIGGKSTTEALLMDGKMEYLKDRGGVIDIFSLKNQAVGSKMIGVIRTLDGATFPGSFVNFTLPKQK